MKPIKNQRARGLSNRSAARAAGIRKYRQSAGREQQAKSHEAPVATLEKFAGESAVLLAIGTGLFYCAGKAKFEGYLHGLGLDGDVMERSVPQTIYQGMLQMLVPIVAVLGGLFLLRQLWLLSIAVKETHGNHRLYKTLFGDDASDSFRRLMQVTTPLALVGVVIALLKLFSNLEKDGVAEAEELISSVRNGTIREAAKIRVTIDDKPKELVFLACGEKSCAGLDLADARITYFSERSYSFVNPQLARAQSAPKSASATQTQAPDSASRVTP